MFSWCFLVGFCGFQTGREVAFGGKGEGHPTLVKRLFGLDVH